MEDNSIHIPSPDPQDAKKRIAKIKFSSATNPKTPKTNKKSDRFSNTCATQDKRVADHGEFNLPPRPKQAVINIDDSDDDDENNNENSSSGAENKESDNNEDDDDDDDSVDSPLRLGTLPPSFYRLHPPTQAKPTIKIPLVQVKLEAATHSDGDRQILHLYIQATIKIKADMPDWPGLMKVYDFLHFQVGPNATILVLPSKRRGGGDENPITTRWNSKTNRSIFTNYFQGYTLPKTPLSAAAAKKTASAVKKDTSKNNTKPGTTLNVRVCISIFKFQLPTLDQAAKLLPDPFMTISVDPIRSEIIEKIGWITGTHKDMNHHHWEHFLAAQLTNVVGCSYDFRLEMEALSPPRGVSGNERFRQSNPKRGVDPIQLWRVHAGKSSASGLSSALHSLFHTTWKDKLFDQDMLFLPSSTGDTPEGKTAMWTAAKSWQDSTVSVKSFGLCHLHNRITLDDATESDTPHSLAYYCRKIHHSGGPSLFRAIEERATTATDKITHGNGHVVYFLVHRDDKRVAEMFASDVFNTLAYTNPRLTMANVYRKGDSYIPLATTQAVADAEAAEALAALTLRVNGLDSAIKPTKLDLDKTTATHSSPKTTASNPLDTPTHTPQRSAKKQRVLSTQTTAMDIDRTETPTTSVSTLTATEAQRLADLELQVQELRQGSRTINKTEMGYMLKHVLMAMFPSQEAFAQVIFDEMGLNLTPSEYITTSHQPLSPPTPPGASHATDAFSTTSNYDQTNPVKQAEVEDPG